MYLVKLFGIGFGAKIRTKFYKIITRFYDLKAAPTSRLKGALKPLS